MVVFLVTCALSDDEIDEAIANKHSLIEDIHPPLLLEHETDRLYLPFEGSYSNIFNDLNEVHLEAAAEIGFAPLASRNDTSSLKGKLIYHEPGEYENFIIDSLEYSIPIMIPRVSKLIDEIGANFRDSLKLLNSPDCKIIVTSLTRTDEDVKKLKRRNRNAIEESTHRYGTTFDISWIRFKQVDTLDTRIAYDRLLKKALGQTLYRLQQENKCFIKYEHRQKCFHITVRKND